MTAVPHTAGGPPSSPLVERLRRRGGRASERGDAVFHLALLAVAGLVLAVLGLMVARTTATAWPALSRHGGALFTGERWAPASGAYGGAAFIVGTLVTALIAIVLAVPVSLGIALCLNELAPRRLRTVLVYAIELLAAVPSVVYGLWAVVVLVPRLQEDVWQALSRALGWIPLFAGPVYGTSVATAGLVLAIMIVPIVTAIAREVTALTPVDHKEAALALGATRFEMIRLAVLPHARSGLVGAVILGLGRAMGETIAVALVVGGTTQIETSLFQPGYTIASVIANTFNEATGTQVQALVALGVVLFAVTIVVNVAGRLFVARAERRLA